MKQLIKDCHDRNAVKHRHAKTAIQMFRSLVEADVVSLVDDPERPGIKRAQVNVDLQREFSLNYSLSLYVVETIRLLNRELDSYPLDLLSLVEAILENPTIILRKQLDRIKGVAVGQMKAEGIEYDERMERLAELDYPKPNADFIYDSFNAFAARHPWVGQENIRPKGAARELYEQCHDFRTFVVGYKLERAEGMVLRYLTDVYKALTQTVPEWARTPEVEDLIDYFGGVICGVDASLLEEWERLRDPAYVPDQAVETPEPEAPRGITANQHTFTVLVRNAIFRVVQQLSRHQYGAVAETVQAPTDEPVWTAEGLRETLAPYYEDHQAIRTDPRARGTEHCRIDRGTTPAAGGVGSAQPWRIVQVLVDPDEHNDWMIDLTVDLDRSDEADGPVLVLHRIGS
jgi:hypothetical protein